MVQVERRARPRGRTPAPGWYWLVAIAATLWGAAGCFALWQHATLGADAMGPASGYDRALFESLPDWYHWAYGIAVIGGLAGGIALLIRSRLAQALFLASLIAALVQFGWLFAATDVIAAKGAGTVLPFPVFIIVVAAFQVWFAGWAAARGWVR